MTWYGVGLAMLVLCFRPAVICTAELKGFSKTVLRRASKSAWMIWCGFYLFHLISWIRLFDVPITLANVAPAFIVLAFVSKREDLTWVGCMMTVICSLADPSLFWINAMLAGSVFLFNGWKHWHPRLYLGAIMAMHVALVAFEWQGGPFPEPEPWVHVLTGICLIATGIGFRLFSAAVAAFIWVFIYWKPRGPEDIIEWGALFIAIAFATLVSGIFLSWKYRFWPANGGNGNLSAASQNAKNVPSANRPLQAKSPEALGKGLAKDLNGFCPYCSFHMNAGKSKCDKCGKTFY